VELIKKKSKNTMKYILAFTAYSQISLRAVSFARCPVPKMVKNGYKSDFAY
jgi:hypothetical protein